MTKIEIMFEQHLDRDEADEVIGALQLALLEWLPIPSERVDIEVFVDPDA